MATFSNSPFSMMQFATQIPTDILYICAWKTLDFPTHSRRSLLSKASSAFESNTRPFLNIGYRFLTVASQDIIPLGRPRTRHSKRIREIASHTHLITYEPVLFLLLRFILRLYVEFCAHTYIIIFVRVHFFL